MILTRCPQCGTRFRVTPEQLRARQGRVRCGRCRTAFDALEGIVQALPVTPGVEGDAAQCAAPAAGGLPVEVEMAAGGAGREDETRIAPPGSEASSQAELAAAITQGPEGSEAEEEPAVMRPRIGLRARAWSVATALLVALGGAQSAYIFRSDLAVTVPSSRPWLEQACSILDCEVGLPRHAELLSVEASDLRPHAKGQLALTATLRNRAAFPMEFPHLELTLTDTADRALARRVFPPREYLVAGEKLSAGLPAQADFQLALAIEAASLDAAGYRLYVFYP
ncbi:MAG: hypothetical protein OHK0026_05880 [Rhodocyclaceae bacterium]